MGRFWQPCAPDGVLTRWLTDALEQRTGVGRGLLAQRFVRDLPHFGQAGSGMNQPCRFIGPLTALGLGRKVRGVRFQ